MLIIKRDTARRLILGKQGLWPGRRLDRRCCASGTLPQQRIDLTVEAAQRPEEPLFFLKSF